MARAPLLQTRLRNAVALLPFPGALAYELWMRRQTGTVGQMVLLAIGIIVLITLVIWYVCQPGNAEAKNDLPQHGTARE